MKFMCIYTLNVEGKTNAGLLSGDPLNIRKKCVVHYNGTELALLAQYQESLLLIPQLNLNST